MTSVTMPITLRDVRRACVCTSARSAAVLAATADSLRALGAHDAAGIDQLINRLGAGYIVINRPVASRQDHVINDDMVVSAPVGVENADAHGGDGNSGEMDHRADTSATEKRDDCDSAACDAIADTPDGTPEEGAATDCNNAGSQADTDGASTREGGEMPTCQGTCGGDEPTREMGSQLPTTQTDVDKGTAGDRLSASDNGTDCRQLTSDATAQAHGESQSFGLAEVGAASGSEFSESVANVDAESHGAVLNDGGQYLSAPIILRAREQRAMRETAYLLRRLIENEIGSQGRETPRVNGRTLMREIVSRRCAIARARRREADMRELIIAVDDSGSCAAVVNTLYSVALAIAHSLPSGKASVLLHSNGYCVQIADNAPCSPWLKKEIEGRSRLLARHYYAVSQQEASAEIWRAIAKRRPGLVLAMGDHDADWALEILRDAGNSPIAIHHHAVSPNYGGVRRIGPVRDAMSAAQALSAFVRRNKRS